MTTHNANGILQHPPLSEPEPAELVEAPAPVVYSSCATCGAASAGRCCQTCNSAHCMTCGAVIWRDECWHADHRGIRHTRCEGGAVMRPA